MTNFYKIPQRVKEQHIAILGKAGSGKTVVGKGMAENILEAGGRVCAVDPTGVWWGLKSSATGKRGGFPVVIFGGEHSDFPITETHGAAIAEIVASTETSTIIDTSMMHVGQRTRFFTAFAETLLMKNKGPLNLIIDEMHVFAPQGKVNDPQAGKMLSATNNMVSLGRARGLRITMISQRPAKLHKDSLTQAETLIAMRLIAPQDRGAVEDWIGEWAGKNEGKDILKSLPSMTTGTGWIWSPEIGILEKVQFPMIKTYDSSKAPVDGEMAKLVLAPIDMDTIGKKLEQTAQDILNDDPKRLRARIAELERAATQVKHPDLNEANKIKDRAFQTGRVSGYVEGFTFAKKGAIVLISELMPPNVGDAEPRQETKFSEPITDSHGRIHKPLKPVPKITQSTGSGAISGGERKIMTALAMYPQGRTKIQIGILTGYKIGGGGFNNYMGGLRTKGWIEGRDQISITDEGLSQLGHYEPLPIGKDLIDYWIGNLEKAPSSILRSLINVYPKTLDKAGIAAATGYEPGGGGFNNALGKLRTLELIEGRGEMKASDDFFQ